MHRTLDPADVAVVPVRRHATSVAVRSRIAAVAPVVRTLVPWSPVRTPGPVVTVEIRQGWTCRHTLDDHDELGAGTGVT
jgi:hypothetical protein